MERALILDCDGVVAETAAAHLEAANAAFAAAGLDLVWDQGIQVRLSQTAGFRAQIAAYFGRFGWPGGEADNKGLLDTIEAAHRGRFIAAVRCGAVALRLDVGELIDFAASEGWKLAVCSDDPADLASACVSLLGLKRASAIAVVAGADDAEKARPDPAPYASIAERLDVPPADCLAIVSRAFGVRAAQAAGMRAVTLTEPGAPAPVFGNSKSVETLSLGPEGLGPVLDFHADFPDRDARRIVAAPG